MTKSKASKRQRPPPSPILGSLDLQRNFIYCEKNINDSSGGKKNHSTKKAKVDDELFDVKNDSNAKYASRKEGNDNSNNKKAIACCIGLISDTHGILENSVIESLASTSKKRNTDKSIYPKFHNGGSDLPPVMTILHSGDIGDKRTSRLKPKELLDRLIAETAAFLSNHCGNKVGRSAIEKIDDERHNVTIVACRGNVDDEIPVKHKDGFDLPTMAVHFEPITQTRILILHGDGIPARIKNRKQDNNDDNDISCSTTITISDEAWAIIFHHKVKIVVYGYSHIFGCHKVNGILFINPGGAGPRRFKLPRSCGKLFLMRFPITTNSCSSSPTEVAAVEYKVEYYDIDSKKTILEKCGKIGII